jgi:hypothetical protein
MTSPYIIAPHTSGPSLDLIQSAKITVPSSVGVPPTSSLLFDRYEMGVRSFVLPRRIDTYKHFILIFVIKQSDTRYSELYSFLENWMKQTKFTIGYTQPINLQQQLLNDGLSRLSSEKVYFCDLRKEKDIRCGLHVDPHPEQWITNQAACISLDRFRGLIVFADDIDQIPSCWVTKSIGGLTSESNIDPFLKKGLGVHHTMKANINDNSLHGYIKMIRNSIMTSF